MKRTMVSLAIALAVAIVVRRLALLVAVGALASELVVDAVVLRYALGESDHSDGKLLLAGLAGVVTGLVAVIAARRAQNLVALPAASAQPPQPV